MATFAPALAHSMAQPRPIPLDDPVMKKFLPVRFMRQS